MWSNQEVRFYIFFCCIFFPLLVSCSEMAFQFIFTYKHWMYVVFFLWNICKTLKIWFTEVYIQNHVSNTLNLECMHHSLRWLFQFSFISVIWLGHLHCDNRQEMLNADSSESDDEDDDTESDEETPKKVLVIIVTLSSSLSYVASYWLPLILVGWSNQEEAKWVCLQDDSPPC